MSGLGLGLGLGLRQARRSIIAGARATLPAPSITSCSLCGQCQGASGSASGSRLTFARLQSTAADSSNSAQESLHRSAEERSSRIHLIDGHGKGEMSRTPYDSPPASDTTREASETPPALPEDKSGKAQDPISSPASSPSQLDILTELEAWASARAKLSTRHPYLRGPQLSLLAHINVAVERAWSDRTFPPPAELVRLHDELLESPPHGQTCEPSGTTFAVLLRYAYRQGDAATLKSLSYHATKWHQADARAKVAQQMASPLAVQSSPSASVLQASDAPIEGVEPEVDLLALIHNLGLAHRTRGGRRTLSLRMLRAREAALQEKLRQASVANQDLQMRFAYNQMLNPRGIPAYREGKVADRSKGAADVGSPAGIWGDISLSDSPFETEVTSRSAFSRTRYSRLHQSRSKRSLMRQLAQTAGSRASRGGSRVPGTHGRVSSGAALSDTTMPDALLDRWQSRLLARNERRSVAESEVKEMIVRMRNEAGDMPIGVPTWLLLSALRRRAEQGEPKQAKSLVAAYMASLREAGRVEGRTMPNPQKVYAVSRPDQPPAGSSLLNLVLRAHLVADHPVEKMLETMEQMTGKKGWTEKIMGRVYGEAKDSAKSSKSKASSSRAVAKKAQDPPSGSPRNHEADGSVLPIDVDKRLDPSLFEYRVMPNETTIMLLLEGIRQRKLRVLLGTSIVRQAIFTWMPSGKGATSASSPSALASRRLQLTSATARTLLAWALRERKDSTKLARAVLALHKRYRELEGRRARQLSRAKGAKGSASGSQPRRGGEISRWRRVLYRAMKAKVISHSHYLQIC